MTRVFGVDYAFLSCGRVFTDGLVHAAAALGMPYAHAAWDVPDLPGRIAQFNPDLVFVVHGRKFTARWGKKILPHYSSAVWLLDEPYETDETSSWSGAFGSVFVNDPATLPRHRNATYLPVCYDPHVHVTQDGPRPHAVAFIGGGNSTRDRYLAALADAGLLTYVIGGPWNEPSVKAVCRSGNIPAHETADWYRATQIIVNVFRERHHYNREQIPATSLNPRVYEALACGCLVVSEWRPEVDAVVPELPTFRTEAECVELVRDLLAHPDRAEVLRVACAARLAGHTYADRLSTVLAATAMPVEVAS